jgi:hypothetical protein
VIFLMSFPGKSYSLSTLCYPGLYSLSTRIPGTQRIQSGYPMRRIRGGSGWKSAFFITLPGFYDFSRIKSFVLDVVEMLLRLCWTAYIKRSFAFLQFFRRIGKRLTHRKYPEPFMYISFKIRMQIISSNQTCISPYRDIFGF